MYVGKFNPYWSRQVAIEEQLAYARIRLTLNRINMYVESQNFFRALSAIRRERKNYERWLIRHKYSAQDQNFALEKFETFILARVKEALAEKPAFPVADDTEENLVI